MTTTTNDVMRAMLQPAVAAVNAQALRGAAILNMSPERGHDLRVAARMAFADRRKRLISDWLVADGVSFASWRAQIASDLQLVNDAEISMMGGLW